MRSFFRLFLAGFGNRARLFKTAEIFGILVKFAAAAILFIRRKGPERIGSGFFYRFTV